MRNLLLPVGLAALMGACGASYVDRYERSVYDFEPVYCYQSIGGGACFRKPYHRDERRLVNYFGPHPSRYRRPEPPEPAPHAPPAMINYWVKDPEPIPRPAPQGNVTALPWLDPAVAGADADRFEFARAVDSRAGTQALLDRIVPGGDGAAVARDRTNAETANTARPAAVNGDGAEAGAAAAATPTEAPPPSAAPVPPVVEVPVN